MPLADQFRVNIALEDAKLRCAHCGDPASLSLIVTPHHEQARTYWPCPEDEAILRDKIEAFVSVMAG